MTAFALVSPKLDRTQALVDPINDLTVFLIVGLVSLCIGTFSRPRRNDWIAACWIVNVIAWLGTFLLTEVR